MQACNIKLLYSQRQHNRSLITLIERGNAVEGDMIIPKKLYRVSSGGEILASHRKLHLVRGDWGKYSDIMDAHYLVGDTIFWSQRGAQPKKPYLAVYTECDDGSIDQIPVLFSESTKFLICVESSPLHTVFRGNTPIQITVSMSKLIGLLKNNYGMISDIRVMSADNPDLDIESTINHYRLISDELDGRLCFKVCVKNNIKLLKDLSVF